MFLLPIWLTLAILNGLSSNAYNFLNRYILKDGDDSTTYAWYVQLLRLIAFSTLAIFDWHIIITPTSIMLFILLGLTEWITIYLYMKMHSYSHLSISAILSRTRIIWVPIIGFFFIHESLNAVDYFSILIIFLGVSTAIAPKKLFIDKGAFYANASAFMIALNIVLFKMALPYGSNGVLNMALALPSVILFPLVMKNSKERFSTLFKSNLFIKSLAIGLNIIGLLLFTFALRYGEASKINAVYQGMLILSVLAGIIFLKERENIARKLIGATITIVGVVLLSLS